MNVELAAFIVKNLTNKLLSAANSLGQMVGIRVALILSNFTIHHAPIEKSIFLKKEYSISPFVQAVQNIVFFNTTTPPAISKIFVYNTFIMYKQKASMPFPNSLTPLVTDKQVGSYKNLFHSSALYSSYTYYPPAQTKSGKFLSMYVAGFGLQVGAGFVSLVARTLNHLFKSNIFQYGLEHLYWKADAKSKFQDWLYINKTLKDSNPAQRNNILKIELKNLSKIHAVVNAEGGNFINYSTEVLVQFRNTVSNIALNQSIQALLNFVDTMMPIGNSNNRKKMFQKNDLPAPLRNLYYTKNTQQQVIKYLTGMYNKEKQFQILWDKYEKLPIYKKKKYLRQIKSDITFPTLLIFSEYGGFWARYLVQMVDYYVAKSFMVSFDCESLKRSFEHFADKPEAASGSFLNSLFNIVKQNYQLKKIFWDTKNKEYRLDILVFPNAQNLLRTRFDTDHIRIDDFLGLMLFLEKLHTGIYASYIITMDAKSLNHQIDPAIRRRVNYIISIQSNKNQQKIQIIEFLFKLDSIINFSSITDLSMNDLISWSCVKLAANEKCFSKLKTLFIELYKICKTRNFKFNEVVLELLAKKMLLHV